MLDLFETTWEDVWAGHESAESYGAVYTRAEIVDLVLDLTDYRPELGRLATRRVLEPSCGDGAFVLRIIQRLIASERMLPGGIDWMDPALDDAIRAIDIHAPSIDALRRNVAERLSTEGCPSARARSLSANWLHRTDFLLHEWTDRFDVIVGNPPYVRIEDLPRAVLQRYRSLYATLGDRADLYVAFIERGLQLLAPCGVLGFITANRYAKNLYGRGLRRLIADRYHVRYFLNLEHTQPFEVDVSAYPAITVLDRQRGCATRAGELHTLAPDEIAAARNSALVPVPTAGPLQEFDSWYPDGGPWVTTCTAEHRHLHTLRTRLVPLEASAPGTRVGIGVATGADRVFVLTSQHPAIEAHRQIPLAVAADLSNREICWSGHVLLNPFTPTGDGSLVDLAEYPGLHAYLLGHRERLGKRHVARSRPHQWYRTIDRIWPELQHRPKLLIPDIQPAQSAIVAHDEGRFYPHHNLYWITSEGWDLQVLKALLRCSIVIEQVRAFSVQMRGGSVRWQAQTLRKLNVPPLSSLRDALLWRLKDVAGSDDQREIDEAAARAFYA
ncbi:MAG TPA: Eco57I restriction-modification methylase domain-containing protein [Longimicrobium sp.]|nr:Eco57I restriction-modification methylase domain-containing protein [Longimicrobium sp.]